MGKHTGVAAIGVLLTVLIALGGATPPSSVAATPEEIEFFEKKIRPLLVNNCHDCHSADSPQKGKLLLDSRAGLLKGGESGPAVAPGKPGESRLLRAVGYQDDVLKMPPRGKLSDEQIADLTRWVKRGTPWPEGAAAKPAVSRKEGFDLKERSKHWSFQPVKSHASPAVKNKDWPRSPIDRFVLAKLEAAGLSPAKPADRRTLIRRVTYDLIGLPPTPAEIDTALSDPSPAWFEKVVDRLLASPHYGERWGRHWLDLVRYAETCGHEFDFDLPEAHLYRDYVTRAFNADLPYDQFVTEHVVGDLLSKPRRHATEGYNESILGTSFWFLGEAKHSPVDILGDEADRLDNQIDVFAKAFLGLTVSCARCHDHKFDAISQKDYYALLGYLHSSRYQRAFIDDAERMREAIRPLKELQAQSRDLAVAVTAQALRMRLENVDAWRQTLQKLDPKKADALFQPWLLLADPKRTPEQFTAARQQLVERLKSQRDKSEKDRERCVVFADFNARSYQDWYVTGEAFGSGPSQAADVIVQPDKPLPVSKIIGPGIAHSGLVSSNLQGALRSRTFIIDKKKILYHVAGRGTQINLIIDNYQHIRDPIYGGLTIKIDHGEALQWRGQDVSMWQGHRAYIEIIDDGPGSIAVDQILFSDDGPPAEAPNPLLIQMLDDSQVNAPDALARKYQELFREIVEQWHSGKLASVRDCADRVAILNGMLQSGLFAAPNNDSADERRKLTILLDKQRQKEASQPTSRRSMAMADGTAWNVKLYIRGNHKNLGEEVPRRFLEAIAGSEQPAPDKGSGRLDLARRLVEPANPFVARVMVNRIWQHHFGEGIVRSVDNFGVLGEEPTHPELLDFLATEFVRRGWSMKQMHRLMLLSSTYQMASRADASADEADPQNKLLHRMPIRRLEAECIRDAMLAASGRLDQKLYGPGVLPYLTPHMSGRGRPNSSGPLDGDGRRSLYLNVRRNFLTPMFLAFDYPIPFTTIGRRSVSNVPAQALALMNNPFVVQQAERWAKRVLAEPDLTPTQRVTKMYVTAFSRLPTDAELADALAFLEEQGKAYGRADDPKAWTDLCHVLFNVKEFIFLN